MNSIDSMRRVARTCLAGAVAVGLLDAAVFFSLDNSKGFDILLQCVLFVAGAAQAVPALLGICLLAWVPAKERHARDLRDVALVLSLPVLGLGVCAALGVLALS